MYWPNGVPRVYAVNGPDIARVSDDGHHRNEQSSDIERRSSVEAIEQDVESPETSSSQGNGSKAEPLPDTDTPHWEDEAIHGLCVSRSGHMFATITESSIALWQTRVCVEHGISRGETMLTARSPRQS